LAVGMLWRPGLSRGFPIGRPAGVGVLGEYRWKARSTGGLRRNSTCTWLWVARRKGTAAWCEASTAGVNRAPPRTQAFKSSTAGISATGYGSQV
jgi:hypothetical protein